MTIPSLVPPSGGIDATELEVACAAIRSFCGWHIAPVIDQELILDGTGGRTLLLPTLNLTAVTSVTEDGAVVDDADWEWSRAGFIHRRHGCRWTTRLRGLTAAVSHGYDACPPEVRAVAYSLAQAGQGAAGSAGVSQEAAGPFTVTYTAQASAGSIGLGPYEQAILSRYQVPDLT